MTLGVMAVSVNPMTSLAEHSITGGGHIGFEGEDNGREGIQDPENPSNIVDPGSSPSTTGKLRIDFVPKLNFSLNKISKENAKYPVNAQLFHDATGARGNFVQVTDSRDSAYGWQLQLRQETQFQNPDTANSQLNGAVLSFDISWANSTEDKSLAPLVSKEVIQLNNIGETYNLANANSGKGNGTWSISFGASADNPMGLENTLNPKLNAAGEPMLDSNYENKQIHENSAIKLAVPGSTEKDPVPYSTVLTWVLAELP
ncbi:hypothetical protein RV18_GL001361 [Enterococcus termitis]|nr:hypothetical protein RV18_GL001361 [Enterococcus termitis]